MIKINMGVVIIFVISPTHRSPNSLSVSRTVTLQEAMATRNLSFEEILEEKPTLDELCDNASVTYKPLQCIPTNPVPSESSPTSPNQLGGLPINMSMTNLGAGS